MSLVSRFSTSARSGPASPSRHSTSTPTPSSPRQPSLGQSPRTHTIARKPVNMPKVIEGPSGNIVAFEGHPETISTQLRLLPTSPQILILPSVQCYLPTNEDMQTCQPHTYIRKAHEAVAARNEAARAFLKGSSPSDKRLVFMNGGTPSAQALCIRHIMRHETQGDDVEAEAMFNYLVKEGLGGLKSQAKRWHQKDVPEKQLGHKSPESASTASPKTPSQAEKQKKKQESLRLLLGELDEDPITRAMRAAEALDRSTENLQPSNELDLTLNPRPRSMSLPMYGYLDNFGDAAPFHVFGAEGRRRATSDATSEEAVEDAPAPPAAPRFSVTHFDEQNLDLPPLTGFTDPEQSPSCVGETYGPTFLHSPLVDALPTSKSDVFDIRTPAEVVYGEASLVDMRLSSNKPSVARVRSLDRIYPSGAKYSEMCIPAQVAEDEPEAIRRPQSCMAVTSDKDSSSKRISLIERPRTVLMRPKQASIVSLGPVPIEKKRKSSRMSYVDRGTDAEAAVEKTEPFSPVLPVTEDLVIYFKDETPDALLDTVVKGFKDGNYPVLSPSPDGSEADTVNDQMPSTPKSQSTSGGDETPKAIKEEPTVVSPSVEVDEYDPFAYVQNTWPPPKPVKNVLEPAKPVKVERPPTPDKTPVPSVSDDKDDKFHVFKVNHNQTAVIIQNSLRAVLDTYYPPGKQGYRQFSFSLLPDLEGLWKPIFREAEPGSPRPNNRRMDQILAVGSQKGVKKEYSSAIVGLLDKLGAKSSGMSRSGRLDFRYLLANAMQAYTAQPLTNQTTDNPFNNPYLLATLIIPHLETYLALHSEVRYLLLEYPPEHTSTILALQKLVGVDLMKVAQIVDSKSPDMGCFTHIRGTSLSNDDKAQSLLGKPVGSSGSVADYTVGKANFLLTSSASDTEIATFIATVRKILMDVSNFYTPEETQKPTPPPKLLSPKTKAKPKPAPLNGNLAAFPKASSQLSPTTPSPTTTNTLARQRSTSPAPSTRAASIAETIRTYKTTRTGKSTKKSRRRIVGADEESIMTFDPAEDSDYDQEERRLMPIFMQKPSKLQKPNSRKALKFLGLA